ncbi:unnamed protein product (macronuclear) [Paramecium tetraurelia]|uniref:Uncharacterized protein n=1 Tax=Paramecium tetraurelia TaxID=5888 RepID=A0CSY7_PARTE|nr:uncharacterized protein GSPATT00010177001 [Paramecium tetraurelia]CAK73904.1 unnamed protein product [Paramecium tetraurelia]|eukprot:XP_001441301.1 hypothetical protein (macronuclear) [Paramecium tetraurelia strain d4-2]
MSPNKNQRSSEANATYSTGFSKKTTNKAPQSNQTPISSQLPEITKKKTKNDILCYSQEFQDILQVEIDERYRYLVKNGTIKKIENGGNIIFSELQQIPGIWVCYRRPMERSNNLEKLSLDYLDLTHMPLLEGEEKLKILTYQHNRIQSIQNLVSLPNLLYLDLYDNQLKEIDELKQVQKLKVLLLPKNQIRRIQNLDHLTKLEVLDLHSNRIINLEGLSKLKSLKILNVGNNLITKLEALEELNSLIELNIKMNQIENIDHLQVLPQLQKLFMSQNKINSFPCIFNLSELSLENNPIQTNKSDYYRYICQTFETLRILDGKPIDQIKQEILFAEIPKTEPIKKKTVNQQPQQQQQIQQKTKKPNQMGLEILGVASEFKTKEDIVPFAQIKKDPTTYKNSLGQQQSQQQQPLRETIPSIKNSLTNTAAAQEDDILVLIKKQWTAESRRIQTLEKNNQFNKKSCLEHQLVEGGHAEVEDDVFLLIYGTASAMVLPTQNFSQIIEKIHFQYVFFDSIIDTQLTILQDYSKLRELILKDNYINSLLQLAKLEHLNEIQKLTILNNPINNCSFMFQFLVYRFPSMIQINGKDIRNDDRQKAKQLFSNFDKSLQIPEKLQNFENIRQLKSFQKDRSYIKQFHKCLNDVSNEQKIVYKYRKTFDNTYEEYLIQLIQQCKEKEK